jgi:DnaD/phage-associated family protein
MIPDGNFFIVPNIFTDKLMNLLTPEEFKILIYMARRIYGFHKTSDQIGLSQFARGIKTSAGEQLDYGVGLAPNTIRKALENLKSFGVIIEVKKATSIAAAEYALQNDIAGVDLNGLETRLLNRAGFQNQSQEGVSRREGVSPGDIGGISPGDIGGISPGDIGVYHGVIEQKKEEIKRKKERNKGVSSNFSDNFFEVKNPLEAQAFRDLENLTGSLNATMAQELSYLLSEYKPEWVIEAIAESSLRNVRNLKYIAGILKRWKASGKVKTDPGAADPAQDKITDLENRIKTARAKIAHVRSGDYGPATIEKAESALSLLLIEFFQLQGVS